MAKGSKRSIPLIVLVPNNNWHGGVQVGFWASGTVSEFLRVHNPALESGKVLNTLAHRVLRSAQRSYIPYTLGVCDHVSGSSVSLILPVVCVCACVCIEGKHIHGIMTL